MGDTKALLAFSLGPVQTFIQGARTVRDLKSGSALLCYLVGKAIDAGKAAGGRPLYPVLGAQSIPNQFTMSFDSLELAESAATTCSNAVTEAWKAIADKVKKKLDSKWTGYVWDAGWDEQIKSFWSINAVVLDLATSTLPNDSYFNDPALNSWRGSWRVMSAALAAQKQVRHFSGDSGVGREKCTMMGDLEQMGPGGDLNGQNRFWQEVEGTRIEGVMLREHDRLCAVALVKRFASEVEPALKTAGTIKDTAELAIAAWKAALLANGAQAYSDFEDTVVQVKEALKEDDSPARYLLDDNLDPKKQMGPDLAKRLENKREALRALAGAPPRYLAVLKLDGDKMGDRLGKVKGPEELSKLSVLLTEYAVTATQIIGRYQGHVVYTGGDDLLALMPLHNVLECCAELRAEFPLLPPGHKGTASIGIAVFHYKHPLQDALHKAEAMLEHAKNAGRDQLGWQLLKHSGGPLLGIATWDLLVTLQEAAALFEKHVSDRWLYAFDRIRNEVPDTADVELAETLLMHFVRHMVESVDANGENADAMERVATEAFTKIAALLNKRHAEANAKLPADVRDERARKGTLLPEQGKVGFMPCVVNAYAQAMMFASFLARGKD